MTPSAAPPSFSECLCLSLSPRVFLLPMLMISLDDTSPWRRAGRGEERRGKGEEEEKEKRRREGRERRRRGGEEERERRRRGVCYLRRFSQEI